MTLTKLSIQHYRQKNICMVLAFMLWTLIFVKNKIHYHRYNGHSVEKPWFSHKNLFKFENVTNVDYDVVTM